MYCSLTSSTICSFRLIVRSLNHMLGVVFFVFIIFGMHCVVILIHSFQFNSVGQSCPTLCDPMDCRTPGLPVHHQLPEFTQTMSIELVMPSNHLILCRPLLLLPPIPPSIRVFSNESTLRMRWPRIGVSALASVLPMNTQDLL